MYKILDSYRESRIYKLYLTSNKESEHSCRPRNFDQFMLFFTLVKSVKLYNSVLAKAQRYIEAISAIYNFIS